ncbi:orotate phosphoribosyltransferase [Marinoscillum furvescens]|uniref:Orotate phosphoribosyltransferase n=1 Tax=Marinoscillum furvescens DSM 4134 TaxID=1122208 RepID=A0A3D9L180_MARFU|nr:orotate phosphoribosyltransferase [Marinoscillum furvescens]RED97502.1 orotate phosphoribosyltransferase [Marinoscillum furvescens DSM 4134]
MSVEKFDTQLAEEIADALLSAEAIKIQPNDPFTWASGWKSPIYCDNRVSLSYPKIRNQVKEGLVKLIKTTYPNVECIAGVATAGIPQGALVADALDLPFIYIRSKSKAHGMQNQIEGVAKTGAKVVLIEDLISTGGSSLQAAEAVRSAGMDVIGMAAIFTYGFGISEDNFAKHHVDLTYLSDYPTLIGKMIKDGKIGADQENTLSSWRDNPAQWNQ